MSRYVPDRGDIVYLNFDPTKGREQRGHRPAFILSPALYDAKSSLALVMPITSQQKGYPFEVLLPPHLKIQDVILADQIKCLDWKARQVEWIETVAPDTIAAVQARIQPLIQ